MSNSKRPSWLTSITTESMPLFKKYYVSLSCCLDFCEQLDLDFVYVGETKTWKIVNVNYKVTPCDYDTLFESDDLDFLSSELEKMYRDKNPCYDR